MGEKGGDGQSSKEQKANAASFVGSLFGCDSSVLWWSLCCLGVFLAGSGRGEPQWVPWLVSFVVGGFLYILQIHFQIDPK